MKMVLNAIKTPDGTVLESRHRHDYVTHLDAVTGEEYMIDGGLEYRRMNINNVLAEDLTVTIEDGIEEVREAVKWGTRGKCGTQQLRLIKLSEMTNDHIEACLKTQHHMHPHYREAFQMELEYRKEHGIDLRDE